MTGTKSAALKLPQRRFAALKCSTAVVLNKQISTINPIEKQQLVTLKNAIKKKTRKKEEMNIPRAALFFFR